MFSEKHQGHKIERLKTIYDQKLTVLNKEMRELKLRINSLESYLGELLDKTDGLKKSKEEKIKELVWNYRTMNQRLEQELETKIKSIQNER